MIIEYIEGKRTLNFGRYKVVAEKQDFNAVYQGDKILIHKPTWKQATKIALLLQQAYQEGYKTGSDGNESEYWIHYD